ncbi:O-antigen ligase family protein [Pseudoalteromonas lipolytica]|uniref:O-antigen ligase like membrane protein n=1 Tax=Pseudoalteromonas lipolytica TaxID=570156 RepID=A0ABY1GSA8_9GAMM|nr:O-antigen ligase family protein [Pseudoalteromonas lipolytica]MBE0349609.1 hypothetical protein [Pseudoalteromonas lipolytica LMEB 39]SFT77986.1 O-antigen ligase like membrane protein [Pseudoalteromonas lipolytica]
MKFNNLLINKIIWLFITLFPVLPHTLGAPNAQKVLHIFAFLFVVATLIVKPVRFDKRVIKYTVIIVGSLILYYAGLSLIFTEKLTFKDLPDYLRPIIYLLYIMIPFLYPLESDDWSDFFSFFKKLFIFQILISALVYLPALWPLVDLFKGRPSDDMALHFYRWSGTYGYPSDFSFYLSIFIFYYFCFFANRMRISMKEWVIIAAAFIAMFLSFSRGGLFSTFGILGLAFWLTGARKRKSAYVLIASVFIILTAVVITFSEEFVQVSYILDTFGGEDGNVDDSTSHRLKEMQLAYDYMAANPPFSSGSNRDELATQIEVIESFYGFHLIKWGIVGLLAILLVKLAALYICVYVYKESKKAQKPLFPMAFSVACLIASEVLLFGLSSAISDRFKTLPTFYLLLGYVLYEYTIMHKKHTVESSK